MPIPAGPSDLPAWAPTLSEVAAYVPRRTLVGTADGYGTTTHTFTTSTTPTADEVTNLIAAACNWVLLATGTLTASLEASAADCAALRTAGLVEQTWPDNRDDLTDGGTLLNLATALRKDLAAANIAQTGDDPSTASDDLLPVFVFPDADPYGDCVF